MAKIKQAALRVWRAAPAWVRRAALGVWKVADKVLAFLIFWPPALLFFAVVLIYGHFRVKKDD